eukprot:6196503-Pleurochrysis_carterae.AAC.1
MSRHAARRTPQLVLGNGQFAIAVELLRLRGRQMLGSQPRPQLYTTAGSASAPRSSTLPRAASRLFPGRCGPVLLNLPVLRAAEHALVIACPLGLDTPSTVVHWHRHAAIARSLNEN